MVAVVIGVSMISYRPPPQSAVAKMPPVNPLPGGTHSDPEEECASAARCTAACGAGARATRFLYAADARAASWWRRGRSAAAGRAGPHTCCRAMRRSSSRRHAPVPVAGSLYAVGRAARAAGCGAGRSAARAELSRKPAALPGLGYAGAANQCGVATRHRHGKPRQQRPCGGLDGSARRGANAAPAATPASAATRSGREDTGRVLVPTGRGVYAHTVLAVNSDTGGPIVLQADSARWPATA